MDPSQIESAISEFETRLERLRVLYEQYFMGIEKRPPEVQKKDIERRSFDLRKIRFPTTASRFKFQTLVQRYNTLQQYWNRTCRDIENGTFRRHVQRAERRFANAPLPEESQVVAQERAASSRSAAEDTESTLAAMLDGGVDLATELKSALAEAESSGSKGAGLSPGLGKSPPVGKLGKLGKRDVAATRDAIEIQVAPDAGLKGEEVRRTGRPHPRLSSSPKPAGLAPLKRPATSTGSELVAPKNRADEAEIAAPKSPGTPSKQGGTPPVRPASPPAPSRRPAPPTAPGSSPAALAGRAAVPKRPAPAPAPLAPRVASTARAPMADKRAVAPAAPPDKPARPIPAASSGTLSDERIRAIHQSYVDARKKTNATDVSYEKLAKSIRETEAKLRAKSQGRSIDFDVNIKDGKAILKPRLK